MKKNNYLMRQFWISVSFIGYLGGLLLFCYDSWNSCCLLSLAAIIPIKIYSNAEADKAQILNDNQNKSGIYMWTNIINGKQYIGSSINLRIRFLQYFNINRLIRENSMQICRALLKHGYSNFSITILEYCHPEQCIEREDYYLSCLPHEYNILEKAGSWLGHKHNDETKKK